MCKIPTIMCIAQLLRAYDNSAQLKNAAPIPETGARGEWIALD